jgi:iron complex transport system substrate-binding protein
VVKGFTAATLAVLIMAAAGALIYEKRITVSPKNTLPLRIIPLAPSVTETLYYMGAGDRVIARTRYCAYPPEVSDKPELGGLFDVNYEAAVSLSPDIVILTKLQKEPARRLKALGVNTLVVDHGTLEGIVSSFSQIGEAIGVNGTGITEEVRRSVREVRGRIAPYPPKIAILSVFSEGGKMTVAGNDGFYSEIFKMLNVENPFSENAPYTTVSKEGLSSVKPDIIIFLSYGEGEGIRRDGDRCVVAGSFGFTPGPRFPLLLESFARCIYPEAYADGG